MATVDNYKIKVTVDGQDKIIDLNEEIENLGTNIGKTAAAGIAAFSALAISAVNMAADMDSLSKATGIATGDLYNLGRALEISGGQFDDAGKLFQAFARSLGQVERGSEEAIDAFTKLGVSKQELETLSDEALFNRVIQGLAGMENGFEKTQIAMAILGKGAAGLEFDKLAANLNKASDPELARRFELAADALDNISIAFRELQLVALQVITPILEKLAEFEFTAEDARKAIQVLGALIAAAFAASVIANMSKIISLFQTMGQTIKRVATVQAFLTALTGKGLALVAAAGVAATGAYIALGKAMEEAADEKERLEGDTAAPGTPDTGGGRTVGQSPEEKALESLKAQTVEMRRKNDEANKYQRLINSTIGLSEREANLIKSTADLERSAANEKMAIQKQIDIELSKGKDTNQEIVAELQKQLVEVDKQLGIQKQLKQEELTRLDQQKQITQEINRQATIEQFNQDVRSQKLKDDLLQEKLRGELTQRQYKIALELENALYKFEQQRINLAKQRAILGTGITDQEKADLDTLESLNETRYRNELARIAQLEGIETNRINDYAAGTINALEQISQAFEPYKMAQDAVMMTWNKIGSAIDNFIETGKFKFKDFAASIIADLAKMIAKALIFKYIFEPIMGALGLSIPGRAAGGPVKGNQPYIVGEKGPELFVPKSAGTVIPNNKLGMATQAEGTGQVNAPITNNYITNNINAVDAKSVAQLFSENRKTLLGAVATAQREMPYMA